MYTRDGQFQKRFPGLIRDTIFSKFTENDIVHWKLPVYIFSRYWTNLIRWYGREGDPSSLNPVFASERWLRKFQTQEIWTSTG